MSDWAGTGTTISAATFSYDATLAANRDKVRFHLQDTVSGSGPKPGDGNFANTELDALITAEGSWQRAVAAGFETLAAAWRRHPDFTADGLSLKRGSIADGYAKQAAEWRKQYGTAARPRTGVAGGRAVTRVDGYSDDIDGFTR